MGAVAEAPPCDRIIYVFRIVGVNANHPVMNGHNRPHVPPLRFRNRRSLLEFLEFL
jgi:hypothetical protein